MSGNTFSHTINTYLVTAFFEGRNICDNFLNGISTHNVRTKAIKKEETVSGIESHI